MHLEMTVPLSTTGSLGAVYLLLAHLIPRFLFLVCTRNIKLNPGPSPPLLASLLLSLLLPSPLWKGPCWNTFGDEASTWTNLESRHN